ncbi:MAG: PD-(D/E)XK nuclease family protein [Woeseia sp.]
MTGMYSWLYDALADGAEIVTANKRLARELRRAFDERQLSLGSQSWHTPRIFSWAVWLNTLLDRCDASGSGSMRLDPHAGAAIWERLLKEHAEDRTLNSGSLVRQAQQTWQRLHDWRVPISDLHHYATSDDERLFATIASAYQHEVQANSWIDQAQLAPVVTGLIDDRRIDAVHRIVRAGFDRVVPAALHLFRALIDRGADVREAPSPARNQAVDVRSCTDADAELRAAGLWARRLLYANPAAKVAIVCPGLEQDAPRAARLIREGFAPGWQYGGGRHGTAVNVSYGRRLPEYPLVAVALLWLKWACQGLPSRDVSVLLRNPFAGSAITDGRCRLEAALRRLPDRNWRPASLAAALRGREQSADAVDWLLRTDFVAAMEAERSKLDSPAVWAARIDEYLKQLGWPGNKPLDTAEFQLFNRWRDLLNELSRLDVVRPRIDLAEAVSRLSSFAGETIYQPEAGPGLLQLIGTLEAAGLEFDHAWVCHLDANQWPPRANPMPFVSRALQRKLGMPDATPADTLEFSRRVLQRLVGSATDVVLSWPESAQDLDQAASPLLSPYRGQGAGKGEDPGWHAVLPGGRDAVDRPLSDPVPPIRTGEKVSGGATTVQRQVEDPFSAFAYGRLGIKNLQTIEAGLSASTRGNIIHRALQQLLIGRPSSSEIAKWTGTELAERIERCVDAALAKHLRFADGVLLRLLAIERRRLRALLRRFLVEETRREEFRVLSVEETTGFSRHGIQLELRIDRIDRLADGSLLIADYKTGAPKNLLTGEGEPKQLQLVVYASAMDEAVGGLVLINVDSRGVVYKGAGASVQWDRSPPELWQARLGSWKKTVGDALAGIAAGDVRLNTVATTRDSRPLNVLSRVEEIKRGR